MKWSRLFQPRHPFFWMIVLLNGLSALLSWIAQNRPLNILGLLLVAAFVLGNAVVGTYLAWRLMRDPDDARR